jgi:hypothetical protein
VTVFEGSQGICERRCQVHGKYSQVPGKNSQVLDKWSTVDDKRYPVRDKMFLVDGRRCLVVGMKCREVPEMRYRFWMRHYVGGLAKAKVRHRRVIMS